MQHGSIRTVGIVSKPGVPHGASIVPELIAWLKDHGIEPRIDTVTAKYAGLDSGLPRDQVPEKCQFLIVLGGDGTLLAAAKAIGARPIPVLAVNLGSLGFLTAIGADELYSELERALAGSSRIGNRRMIECRHERGGQAIGHYLALNDVVASKSALARMIELEIFVGPNFVCSYKADGVILATPTGSTAYSLSAGGPIMFPTVAAFSITPICPHMLTNRPVIIPDSSRVEMIYRSDDGAAFVNVDGQQGAPLNQGDSIVCHASSHMLQLIRPPRLLYFDVLREKLHWGQR
jgi:NAD+ kinase